MNPKTHNQEKRPRRPSPRNISVLMFTPHTAVGGGVVTYTRTLMSHLNSQFEAEPFYIGLRPSLWGRFARPLVPLLDAIRLIRLLLTKRHDIYHINPSLVPRSIVRDGAFLFLLHVFRRRNILVFIHGWDDYFCGRLLDSKIKRKAFRGIYRHASRILVLSSAFAHQLELLGIPSMKVRVVTTMFDGASIQRRLTSRHGTAVKILFLARFTAEKGIFELLRAFKTISNDHPNASLVLAGDGPELKKSEKWCQEHNLDSKVQFLGYVDGTVKTELLRDSDIFVLPSYREGCPIALLEAMGAGLSVIVTQTGAMSEIVKNGINGIVLRSPDDNLIADAMSRLIQDPDLRITFGKTNQNDAWDKFEATRVTAKIESEYTAILSGMQT